MQINNEIDIFHPRWDWELVNILGAVISIVAVVTSIPMYIEGMMLGLLILLFPPLLFPVAYALRQGHALKRLGWCDISSYYSHTQNSKVLLYQQHRSLPEPVRKQVGSLSVEEILEFSDNDSAALRNEMIELSKSYEQAQMTLTAPRVTMMMHAIEDAKTCYDEQARVHREIEE